MHRIPLVAAVFAALVACEPEEVNCDLMAAASVSLTVVDEAGDVIPGATATYSDDGAAPIACDDFGQSGLVCGYEVAGDLLIRAEAPGYEAAEQTVTVLAGECHVIGEAVTLTLPRSCVDDSIRPSIVATVAGSSGEALSDVLVTWAPSGGDDSADCDESGSEWICGYEQSGDFVVVASAAGHETQVVDVTVEADPCHVITENVAFSLSWLPD